MSVLHTGNWYFLVPFICPFLFNPSCISCMFIILIILARELRRSGRFSDVTLATEDGHKVTSLVYMTCPPSHRFHVTRLLSAPPPPTYSPSSPPPTPLLLSCPGSRYSFWRRSLTSSTMERSSSSQSLLSSTPSSSPLLLSCLSLWSSSPS